MKYFFLQLILVFSLASHASPWFNFDDYEIEFIYSGLQKHCEILDERYSASPSSLWILENIKNQISDSNPSKECNFYVEKLEKRILESFDTNILIGFQSKTDGLYLQEKGFRYYKANNAYIDVSSTNNNFAYKLKAIKSNQEIFFDESYISYKNNNVIYKVGRVKRWWSPSEFTSLIYSNSARPIPTISIRNYRPINIDHKFFSFINSLDYEIFIGKLERDREIPNTLLFGNRVSFSPYSNLNISLLRVAQYGGKGRINNSKTFIRMLTGKDNTNRDLAFDEQSGNQIAGIDFSYKVNHKNNIYIYGQYLGEDGLDPIIDDRWIGAIFPSKRFEMGGVSMSSDNPENLWKITLEHTDTDTGFKNVTYNHSLYKSGYRYHDAPIGAAIDGDSHNTILNFEKFYSRGSLQIKYQKMFINQNNSINHSLSKEAFTNKELMLRISKYLKNNLNVSINFIQRDSTNEMYRDNHFFIRLEKAI
jgi:hypothetical protein